MSFTFMVSSSEYVTQKLSTMNQARLNHTMVLHVYKEMLDDLELNIPYIANCSWWKTFVDAESNLIPWKKFTVDC